MIAFFIADENVEFHKEKNYKIEIQLTYTQHNSQYRVVVDFKQTGKIDFEFRNIAGTYNQQVLPILVEIILYIL